MSTLCSNINFFNGNYRQMSCSNPDCQVPAPEAGVHFCTTCRQDPRFYGDIASSNFAISLLDVNKPVDPHEECTFKKSGDIPSIQWYYRCHTCQHQETSAYGFCLPCSQKCHEANHVMTLGYGPFICNTHHSSEYTNCLCANPQCHRIVINENINGCPNFCPYCRTLKTTDGINVFLASIGYPSVVADLDDRLADCTYNMKGNKFYLQWWWNCYTCFKSSHEGVCNYCIHECRRKGHPVVLRYGPFYCDKLGKCQKTPDVMEL